MNPNELILAIEKLGVQLSKTTINRYEREMLISSPKRGSLGRGGGRWAEYPELTDIEAVVAWKMMNGQAVDGMRFSTEFTRYGRLLGFWNIAMQNERELVLQIPRPMDEIYDTLNILIKKILSKAVNGDASLDQEIPLHITIPEIDKDIISEMFEHVPDKTDEMIQIEKYFSFCKSLGEIWPEEFFKIFLDKKENEKFYSFFKELLLETRSEAQELFNIAEQLHNRVAEEQKQMDGNEKYEGVYSKIVAGRDGLCDNYLSYGVMFAVRSYLKTYIEVMAMKEKNG